MCECRLWSLMVSVLNSWKLSHLVSLWYPPTPQCWLSRASLLPACVFSSVDGFVCVCVRECVCGCMFKIGDLKILFGGLLPDFCIVVSLNYPICICVECPILKPVKLCIFSTCWWPSFALLLLCSPPLSYSVCVSFLSTSNFPTCTSYLFNLFSILPFVYFCFCPLTFYSLTLLSNLHVYH